MTENPVEQDSKHRSTDQDHGKTQPASHLMVVGDFLAEIDRAAQARNFAGRQPAFLEMKTRKTWITNQLKVAIQVSIIDIRAG